MRSLGGYLGRDQPPADFADAVADFADALRDGVVESDELTSETLEALSALAVRGGERVPYRQE